MGKINYGGLKHNNLYLGLVVPSGGWQSLIAVCSISFTNKYIKVTWKFGNQGDQMIWNKNRPIFWKVAKTVAKPIDAKIQTMFLTRLCLPKCYKFVSQGIVILGIFFYQWSYKSSLTGEKLHNLVTLLSNLDDDFPNGNFPVVYCFCFAHSVSSCINVEFIMKNAILFVLMRSSEHSTIKLLKIWVAFTTLHFLRNLWIGPKELVCLYLASFSI